jgi:hypothetical protein
LGEKSPTQNNQARRSWPARSASRLNACAARSIALTSASVRARLMQNFGA